MAIVTTDDQHYKDIAATIRMNAAEPDAYTPENMSSAINNACENQYTIGNNDGYQTGYVHGQTDGYNDGYNDGETDGYIMGEQSGHAQGYDEGVKAENDRFWNSVQDYGNRKDYSRGFAYWNVECLSPKHKIILSTSGPAMFKGGRLKTIDKEKFDLSGAIYAPTNTSSTTDTICEYCNNLEVFPDIGLQAGYYRNSFCDNFNLHTIEILRVNENCLFANTFRSCNKLKNIVIEGEIGGSVSWSYSPLSIASMQSIITHLKDFVGTDKEYTCTLTLKSDCWTALDAEGATAPGGTTWRQYAESKGWITA